jgi:hypothetical protein
MVSLDRPWQGHQALAITKVFNSPFYFPQAFEVSKRLIPNLFKIAASIMNVDNKFKIPHSDEFFFLVCYWLVFTFLLSYWLAFTFLLTNTDSRKYADISHYYPHHECARWSPMRIHDVEGKSVVHYQIMNAPSSLLGAFMKKIAGLC